MEHAVTGVVYGIAVDDVIWVEQETPTAGGRREMIRFGQCNHAELGLLKWAIWERTDGTLDDFQAHVGPHRLIMGFEIVKI